MFLQKPPLGTQLDHNDSLNNPVLDLLFNEGHGDRVNDLSGYGNHGTLHNFVFPPTRTSGWSPGEDGVALTFGTDHAISCGNTGFPTGNNARTALARIYYTDSTADSSYLFAYGTRTADHTFAINVDRAADGYIRVVGYNNDWPTEIAMPVRRWVDIAVSFDESVIRLFLDGNLKATSPEWAFDTILNEAYIGSWGTDPTFSFIGLIARFSLFSRAIPAFEVMRRHIDPYGVYLQ